MHMKCKICGYPRAKYVKSRKSLWGGSPTGAHGSQEPRTNFYVKCPKCGAEYEDKPNGGNVNEVQETKT